MSTTLLVAAILGSGVLLLVIRDYRRGKKLSQLLAEVMNRKDAEENTKVEAHIELLNQERKRVQKERAELNRRAAAESLGLNPPDGGKSGL